MRNEGLITRQFAVSPACGKRLIAKGTLCIPSIIEALEKKTIVLIAGSTNGYVAEEMLARIGQVSGFSKRRFFRGVTLPRKFKLSSTGRLEDESSFPGDVVIKNGIWQKGKTIFDVAEELDEGDIVLKGANAVNGDRTQAAVYIGNPRAGTIIPILQAWAGKRVSFYIPVGLEKRVSGDLNRIIARINSPDTTGPRMVPICGNIITELEALEILTGAECELVAAGGLGGAEGSCWIAVTGTKDQIAKAEAIFDEILDEPMFEL
jgi:hypothetical protein